MWGWRSSRTVVIGPAPSLFVVGCVLPLVVHARHVACAARRHVAFSARRATMGAAGQHAALRRRHRRSGDAIGAPSGCARARRLPSKGRCGSCSPHPCSCLPTSLRSRGRTLEERRPAGEVAGHDVLSGWTYSLPAAMLVLAWSCIPSRCWPPRSPSAGLRRGSRKPR